MRTLFLIFLFSSLAFCSTDEKNPVDLSVKLGLISGTITQNSPTVKEYDFGGAPVVVAWNNELNSRVGMDVSLHFVTDFGNSVISRSGLEVGGVFHLLGGARRLVEDNNNIRIVSGYASNLSLALRTGFHNYNASSKDNSESVKGSVLQMLAGLQYRWDLSKDYALGLESNYGFYNVPMGSERLDTPNLDFLMSLRFWL